MVFRSRPSSLQFEKCSFAVYGYFTIAAYTLDKLAGSASISASDAELKSL
jgi:hypothetical protein